MVDYRSYFVDPRVAQQQGLNAMADAARFTASQDQRRISNALDSRRMNLYERQADLGERRESRLQTQTEEEKQLKLLGIQAKLIYRGMENVQDEKSHQAFLGMLNQIGQTPLGKTPFFQRIAQGTPRNYDPQALEKGKAMLEPLIEKTEKKEGYTLSPGQRRYGLDNKQIAYNPDKPGSDLSPSQQINQRKLQAWDAYMKGEATPEQQRMIGVDTDPYLARAAQMVIQDPKNMMKPAKELANETIKLADVLRKSNQQNPQEPEPEEDPYESFLKEYDR